MLGAQRPLCSKTVTGKNWSMETSVLGAQRPLCSKTATGKNISLNSRPIQKPDVGLKPHIWHRASPDPIHFTIFISDNTFIFPSSSANLPARPVFLQAPSIAHHAASIKSDPTHPKQDKKTQRQDAVCI